MADRPTTLRRRLGDALFVARAIAFATVVPLLMRLKLARLEALVESRASRAAPSEATVREVVRNVDRALYFGRPFVRSNCVTRSVTRYYFLRHAGVDVTLCFGMGSPVGELEGHCWLLRDGEPYLEHPDPRPIFRETYRIPRPRAAS